MAEVKRLCTLCEAHCGIVVATDGEHVTAITGNDDDPFSRGYVCPKGAALADLHHDPDRLRAPRRRVGDGWEEIGWDEALALVGTRLRQIRERHGRDAVGMYVGNPSVHSQSAIHVELFRRVLRSRNVFTASSVDQLPQYLVSHEMFGQHVLLPIADVDRTDRLVVIGANPAVSNGSVTTMPDARRRIRDVRRRGGTVVVVDPRRTETARLADEHVAVRPGGDPFLLLGMLHVLHAEELVSPGRLGRVLEGREQLRALVAEWPPERVAATCGVEADVIRRLAREHAAAPSAVAYARIGVCHQPTGSLTHWLVNVLNAVTGNLDRPGGAMFSTPPVDLQLVSRLVSGPTRRGRWTARASGLPEFHGELPVVAMPDEILTPGPGQVRGLVLHAGNPALSSPDAARMDRALASLEFCVAIDPYLTESSRHADVILPPVSPLERDEFDAIFPFLSVRNQARWSRAVFPMPDDGREDWQILAGIAQRLPGGRLGGLARALVRGVLAAATPGRLMAIGIALGPQGILRRGPRRGLTAGRIRRAPDGIDLGPLEPRLPAVLRTRGRRVRLTPPALVAALGRLAAEEQRLAATDEHDLVLIGRRHLRSNNSWMHNAPRLVKGRDRCTAMLHPDDAAARGLVDGQQVRVASTVGAIEVPLEVTDEVRRGVVSVPHGWGHDVKGTGWSVASTAPGANVNLVTDPALVDRLSGNAALNATRVRVEAAATAPSASAR